MAQSIKVQVESGKQGSKKSYDITQGAGDKGEPTRINAINNAKYKLEDVANKGRAPSNISTKRIGRDLHVMLDGSKEADLIIEGYYDEATPKQERGSLYGTGENGSTYEYIPENASSKGLIADLPEGGTPVSQVLGSSGVAGSGAGAAGGAGAAAGGAAAGMAGAGFSWLTVAASVIGAAAVAGGGGKSSSSSSSNSNSGVAPAAPTFSPSMGGGVNDTGASSTDGITKNNKPSFDVGVVPAGTEPQLIIDGKEVPSRKTGPDSNGHYTLTPIDPIPDGEHKIAINYKDSKSGKTSGEGPSVKVVVDTSVPELNISTVSGDDALSAAEVQGAIVVNGTTRAEAGQEVTVKLRDSNGVLHTYTTTVQAGANGAANTYSIQIPQSELPTTDGNYTITADVENVAGTAATQATRTLKIDTTAPALHITSIAGNAVDDSNALEGTFDVAERGALSSTTVTTPPVISGTTDAEAGQVVTVTINNTNHTAVVQADGTWSLTLSDADALALNHGNTYSVIASVTDAAGNLSSDTNNGLVIDIAPPDIPTIVEKFSGNTTPVLNGVAKKEDPANPGQYINLVAGDEMTVTINFVTLDITIGSEPTGFTYNTNTGAWSLDTGAVANSFNLQDNHNYEVGLTVTAGGETKHDISQFELHIRTALPTITLDPVSADNFINKFDHDNGVIITGSTDAEVGSVVTLTGLDGTSRTATVVAGSAGAHVFSLQIAAADVAQFTNTSHTVQASVVNKYGQTAAATQTVEVDFTPPNVTITMDDTALKTGDTSVVTFTFDETPSNFDIADISVVGAQGTLTNLAQSNADPKVWTATFTPTANIEDTTNVISVLVNSYNDPAGNAGNAGNSANFTIDTKAPTVAITLSDSTLTHTDTSTVTFTFNETPDAASFTLADIDVSGAQGTISNLVQDGNNPKVWTATFTPTANTDDSTNVIRLAAGSYTDVAGNSGTAGSSANFIIDTMPPNGGNAPVVSIVADTSNDGTISYAENNSAYVEVSGVPVLTVTAAFDNTKVAVGDTITFTPNSGSAVTVTLTQPMITAGLASTTFARPADGGTLSVSAIITDPGSNSTPAGTGSAVIDLTNSNFTATVDITGMTTDSGVSASDFVTVDHTLSYNGTVTNFTNNGDRVKLELLAADGTTVIATHIVTPVSGAWSWAYETTQADGHYSLRATIIDVTGAAINPSSPVTDTQAIVIDSSGTKKDDGVTDDVNVNATITINSIDDGLSNTTSATGSKDTGTSVVDFVTNDTTLSIYGVTTGFDASEGAQVQVQIYNGSTLVVEQYVVPDNAGKWVFNNTANTLPSGTYTLKAHIVDKAGNPTKDAPDQTLLIDASGSTNQPGNVNDPNASATITVLSIHDTAKGSQDTGPSSTDFITSDNTLIIKGTTTGYTHTGATAGDQLRVQITNGQGAVVLTQYVTPDSSGNWSVDNRANVMADGKYTISTSILDLAGNPVKTGTSQELIINTKKGGTDPGSNPATAPLVDDNATNASLAITAISDDTGYSSTDFITADGTLTISGSISNFVNTGGAVGDKVRVQILKADGSVAAVHYITPTGNTWSFDNSANTLADGNYTLKAAIVDAADNVIKAAPEQALVVSATAVTPTSAVSIGAISTDTGVSVTDFVTNDNTLIVKGATVGFDSATQKLLVKIIKVSDSSEVASDFATVANDGTWSLDNTTNTLVDGSYTIRAVVTDLAGTAEVASTITTHSLVVDTAGTGSANTSATIAVTSIHDAGKDSLDTGVSSTDFITSDSTLIIKGSITGFARTGNAAGDKVRVQILDANSHVIAQQYLTPDGAGVWAMNNQANVLADGTYSIQADIVDLADNVVKAGTPKALVIDTNLGNTGNNGSNANASTVVAITGITDDTGYNTSDFVTSDTTLVINGTAVGFTTAGNSANDKVRVQVIRADGAVLVEQYVVPNGSGAWTLSNTSNALLDGNYTIKAAVVNAAGNAVSTAPDQALVISSGNTPTQATLAITGISDDTGTSATDFITSDTTLTVTGTTTDYLPASGDVVFVQIIKTSDGSVASSGYVTPASNAWSFTTTTLASDLYSIRASYATAAHVENSNPVTQKLIVDNSGTNSPGNNPGTDPNSDASVVIAFSGITNDTGVSNTDYTTTDNTLVISGHIDNFSSSNGGEGDMVRIEIINTDSSHNGDRVAYVAVDSSGNWSLDNTANTLIDGTYTLKAAIVDAADNVVKAAADKTLVINHDSLPTVTASITGVADDVTPIVGSLAYGATTNDLAPVITGTISGSLGANQYVYIYDDATYVGTATVTGTDWTFTDPRTLVNSQRIRYIAQVEDLAGNHTTPSSDFLITIDTSGPAPIGPNDDPLHPPPGTTSLVFSVTPDNVVNIAEAAAANTPVLGKAYGDYTTGDVITITVNGHNYSSTLAADGSFSINVPGADLVADADATVSASLVAHDSAGISGTITVNQTYTFDNTAPTTTVAINSISQDTGSSNTDFITSDNNGLAITGTLSQALLFGEKVWYSNDNGTTWANITSSVSGTTVSYFDGALTSTRTIQMRVGDEADNYSTAASQLVTIDTAGPSPLTNGDDPLNPPAGKTSLVFDVTADNVINTAEGTGTTAIAGRAYGDFTTGDVVTLTVNTHNYSGTLAADGTFSIGVAGADLLADSDTTVSASLAAHDRGGNPGTITATKAYTIDTSAPATTVSISAISQDTGSSSTDFITSDNNGLTVTAALNQALANGEKLWYSNDNGTTWTDITSSVSGTAVSHVDSALTATNTIKMRVGDASNNYSAVASQLITIDTTGPSPIGPNDDPLHPPAGTTSLVFNVTDDNIINTAEGAGTPAITGTARGDYTTGDVVTLTVNGNAFSGTLAADGTFSINVAGSDLLADNTTTVAASLVAHDKGGVAGTITANKSYGVDTTAPSTTVAISAISQDTGANTSDFTTNDSNGLTVTGVLSQSLVAGEKLWYSHDNGATWVDISSSVTGTAVSYVDNALTSTNTIKMRVGDTANNYSAVASQLVTIDTTGPSPIGVNDDPLNPPAGTTSLVLDAVTADNVINATEAAGNVNITGTVRGEFTTGDTVTLVVNATSYTGQVLANGTFSIAVAGTNLAGDVDRSISASVTAHDSANNSGIVTVEKTYTVDIVAPTTSVAIDAISQDSGFDGTDFITSDNNGLTITGTLNQALVSGEKLWYSNDNGATWTDISTSVTGTAVSHADSSLTSTNTIKMRVGDAADNFSAVVSQLVTIDAAAPTTTATITAITDDVGTVTGTVLTGGSTDDNNLSLTGTLSANLTAGQSVRIYDNGTLIGTAVSAVGSSSWTYADNRNLAHNTLVKYTAKVESIAGILTAASNEYTATIRTNIPTITIGSIAADTVTASSDGTYDAIERGTNPTTATTLPVISGTSVDVEEGQIVSVTVNSINYTAAVQADGTWSATLTDAGAVGLNYGNHYSVSASVTDKAGHTAVDSNNRLYADTASPDVPSIVNNKSGTTTPTLTGLAMKEDPSNPGTYLVLASSDTLSITLNGITVSGTIGSLPSGLTYNAGTHTWSLNTAAFNLQDHTTYDVAVTVVAGSVTEHDNSTNELSINTTAPTITLDAISTDGYLNAVEAGQTLSVTGTTDAEIGSVVTLTGLDGTSRTATVAAGAGSTRVFTFNIASSDVGAFTAGSKTASATVVNAFGLSGTDTETLVVDVTGPAFTSSTTATAVNENVASGSTIYTAAATDTNGVHYSLKTATGDVAKFSINANTGAVSIAESPNYEVKDSYTFTVVATDNAGNKTEQAVSLAVNNLDEVAPTITSGATASAITENTATGATVYTAAAVDTDFNSPNTASSITYSLKPATGDVARFSIDASTGAVTLNESPNYETKSSYAFTVVATDAAGNASEQAVTLAVTNVDEVAPTFTSSATATGVDENVLSGTVVYTAVATDTDFNAPNTANSVTYSLKPATGDVARFGINANTGVVTLNEVPDFEAKPSYTFTVIATDAAGNTREQAVSLAVNNVNEAPVVTPDVATHTYTEQLTAVAVNAGITLADVDSTHLTGATVSITNGLTTGDALAFTNSNGITGSYNSGTGVLTLTGNATVAQYQAALQSITFSSTSDNPTDTSLTRVVSWQVDDGASSNHASNVGSSIINITAVNDAPVVTPDVATHTFTEDGSAIAANGALTVADVDSANLSGATVTISAGKTTGDVLAFTNANGITGSYDSTTGVLTLSGSATKAQYQAALRSVTFSNTGADPTVISTTRTLSWQVDDGASANNTSNVGTSTINITALNDAPVLNTSTVVNLNTILEDSGVPTGITGTAVSDLFSAITDADSANAKGVAITSVNGNGTLYYSTDAGTTWTLVADTLADSNALLLSGTNRVYFKPNANWNGTITNAFLYRAWDQSNGATVGTKVAVGAASATSAYSADFSQVGITVNAVNDAPVFTATTVNTVSGNPSTTPVSVFSGTAASMGAANESAQKIIKLGLTVSGLQDGNAETLNVDGSTIALVAGSGTTTTNGLAYTVAVNAGVATVTFTKVAGITSAALVTMVDSMTYANTNTDPISGNRVLTLTTVQDSGSTADGGVDTTALSLASTINITPNNAPEATAATLEATYAVPSTPKLVITDDAADIVDPGTVVHYSLTFSEAIDVATLTESDIVVTNGTLLAGSLARVGASNVWTVSVTTPATGSGTTVVALADGAYTNATGALGKGASDTQTYLKILPLAGPVIETNLATAGWTGGSLTTAQNNASNDESNIANLSGASSNGPGYSMLRDGASMSTTLTGLTVGQTYTYAVHWQQFSSSWSYLWSGMVNGTYYENVSRTGDFRGGSFKITVDGTMNTYTSSGLSDGWQVATYTFTATSTSANVSLASNAGGQIAVDSLTTNEILTAAGGGPRTLTGTSGTDTLLGENYADTITAAGGADTIYTGAGDDKVILNESNATALSGATAMVIDGGSGVNFLQVVNASAAATIDLTNTTVVSRLKNFSSIDLTGSQNNTLKLNWSAISNISGTTDNVATSGVDESKMLVVSGNASDALQLANLSNWIVGSTQTAASLTTTYGSSYQFLSGHSYKAYTLSGTTLFVDDAITTSNLVLTTTTNAASVSSLFGALFTDAQDATHGGTQVLKGVAITFAGATADLTSKGKYQLSADNGITWTDVAADLTDSTAVFAASNALIRFVGVTGSDVVTPPPMTVRLVDSSGRSGTASLITGNTIDTHINGGITAFGANAITVSRINHAPVSTDADGLLVADPLGAATSNITTSKTVGVLFGAHFSDLDYDAFKGVAVTFAGSTADLASMGKFQYSSNGTTWTDLSADLTDATAVFLNKTDLIRFNTTAANSTLNFKPDLTVRLVDTSSVGTSGSLATGATVDVSGTNHGGATAISDASLMLAQLANHAPVLADTTLAFANVTNEGTAPTGAVGVLVSSLVGGATDADAGASKGIAITGVDTTKGTLWVSTNGGTAWTNITTALSDSNAYLLASDADNRVYFQPTAAVLPDTSTTAITFRAWDATTGTEGTYANAAVSGGHTAFSATTDTLSQKITPALINLSMIASGTGGFVINGSAGSERTGITVNNAGDVNGDGIDDLIIGARYSSVIGTSAGRAYVVFGKTGANTAIDLTAVTAGSGGFAINPDSTADDQIGISASALGDINGDGLADIAVGSMWADGSGLVNSGRTYVIFGKTNTSTVNLSGIVNGVGGGFSIDGEGAQDTAGSTVAGAGDVNGDGIGDIVIGAYRNDAAGTDAGRAYVVFGKTDTSLVKVSALSAGAGYVINAEAGGNNMTGTVVSNAGDINGDGLADVLVGASGNNRSYVVFGKTGSTSINLSAVAAGTGGYVITGGDAMAGGHTNYFEDAGDVNGDGLADVIVGAIYADPAGVRDAGRAYVVFGKTSGTAINLSAVLAGNGGFAINGTLIEDQTGWTATSAGDFNGDGLADLLVGARYGDVGSTSAGYDAGRTFVVYGKTSGGAIDVTAVAKGSGGFVINGQGQGDESGAAASYAGDLNGDGYSDLLVGAYYADPAAGSNAGKTYVIYGGSQYITGNVALATGTSADELVVGTLAADVLVGNGGIDRFSAGAGTDTIVLGTTDITNLADVSTSATQHAYVSGGEGVDTIRLKDGASLNLTTISNVSGGAADGASRINSIERIDMATDTTANTLTLTAKDVTDMSPMMNQFNSTNGWVGLGATVQRHQLVVDGTNADTLALPQASSESWALMGTALNGGKTYNIYNSNTSAVQLLVDSSIQQTVPRALPVIGLNEVATGFGGFAINGLSANESAGISISSAGDINGDGYDDLIVGAPESDAFGSNGGRTYVVFGQSGNVSINLSAVAAGSGGFAINPPGGDQASGVSVSGIGDINGDGLADLVTGALWADIPSTNSGRAYVIFGKTSGTAVSLTAIAASSGGFVINGAGTDNRLGMAVSGAGDVNGDGLTDMVIGAYAADAATTDSGKSYVVFGKTSTSAVDATAVAAGSGGFVINGNGASTESGTSVSNAGDVNGDGLADVIVSESGTSTPRSYVVFGKTSGTLVNLSAVAAGTGGFAIAGQEVTVAGLAKFANAQVSSAGDVNGDGFADLIVGSYLADAAAGADSGRAFVVFGKSTGTTVNLSAVLAGSGGFAINGQAAGDQLGISVSGAGDINGDGLADVIVGAHNSDPKTGLDAGRTYVVFGKTGTSAIDLTGLTQGLGGFVINGQAIADNSGFAVSNGGDINGDGYSDLLISAPNTDVAGVTNAGSAYVVFGSSSLVTGNVALATGTSANELVVGTSGADTLVGGGGVDRFSAGAGNDTIMLTNADVANLADVTPTATQHAYVNGGNGLDILCLTSGASLDLTAITNASGAAADGASRINSIECIDMATDAQANTTTLRLTDVIDMSGHNIFNSSNTSAVSGTAIDSTVTKHQLMISGGAEDFANVNLSVDWTNTSTVVGYGGHTYAVYNAANGSAAQLLIDQAMLTANHVS